MNNYTLAHFVSILKVGYLRSLSSVIVPKTKIILNVLDLLYKKGCIRGYFISEIYINKIHVFLKYDENGRPALNNIELVSKPGKRVYYSWEFLNKTSNKGFVTFFIISTSLGLFTSHEILKVFNFVSGEILIKIVI